jgi:hypothetical protein
MSLPRRACVIVGSTHAMRPAGGIYMSSAEDVLRTGVIRILRSRACLNIQFTIVGSTIMGYGYGYVADMIEQGGVKITFGNTGIGDAQYDHRPHSTPTLTFDPNNPAIASSPSGRAQIVHEATHAVLDAVRKGRTIGFGDDEVAAYLAQTIYSLNAGDTINTTGPLAGPLYQLALKVKRFPGPGVYVVRSDEIAGLRMQIMTVYTARARAAGKTVPTETMMQGLAPPGPAMVPD